jgi:hypothetical protein
MSRGKRFESARRLFVFSCKLLKNEELRSGCRGLCQQYFSSRLYANASSMLLAAYLPMEAIQCE